VTRLRDDLTHAHEQIEGEQLLTLFRLTRLAPPSGDFELVLADTRKTYPAPAPTRRTETHPEADSEKRPYFTVEPLLFTLVRRLDEEPRPGESEYYLCVFAFDTFPRRAQHSHTFATFIKASGVAVEAHTISWLPRSQHIELARTQSEPGMNLDLHQTLSFARDLSARVYEWGPYRIRPELYIRSLWQIERLNSATQRRCSTGSSWCQEHC
jgi:hypothetical protein